MWTTPLIFYEIAANNTPKTIIMRVCLLFLLLIVFGCCCCSAVARHEAWEQGAVHADAQPNKLKLWLTISSRKRFLEVSWINAPSHDDDNVLLTVQAPQRFEKRELPAGTPLAMFDNAEGSGYVPFSGITSTTTKLGLRLNDTDIDGDVGSGHGDDMMRSRSTQLKSRQFWVSSNGNNDIVAAIKPSLSMQWFTTGVPFDFALSRNVTIHTDCYGYWASYINGRGDILATTCIRAYPHWMNDLRSVVGDLRLRDLFIPGTHDSGSYRPNFDPLLKETLVTKYSLTQDDDIRGQLMHGVRYLDIRVGYYRNMPDKFFINHGITKQRPLREVTEQVRDFVLETNEIVIFGLKEFPVGFGRDLGVHRLLVSFLREQFDNLFVHPSAAWSATLRDIWSRHQNIIIAYEQPSIVQEFPQLLFGSVDQRWGNVQTWPRLERHLRSVSGFDISRLSSRPVVDMAELTPDTWGVILDRHGGLRKMADNVNWRLSQLYRDELGEHTNIVAADFIRGTTLTDLAIDWNKRKVIF